MTSEYARATTMTPISSWGRLSHEPHDVVKLQPNVRQLPLLSDGGRAVAFGKGRSYGDACLNAGGRVWDTASLDHFLGFEPTTGILTCEAGVMLRDIQRCFVSQGWLLPVSPGTQMATVGGAIANDVHGKNHHVLGTFGEHVVQFKLLRTDGQLLVCSRTENQEYFAATVGGIGLTGVILEATLQLRKVAGPWLETETVPYGSVQEFFALAEQSEDNWEYTVSWIDCLAGSNGRGLFMRGNHVQNVEATVPVPVARERNLPLVPPVSLVNKLSLSLFNNAYFYKNSRKRGTHVTHYQPFFYPLDNLQNWNRMYGPKGFYQYQSVVPCDHAAQVTSAMLGEIARSGQGSFLAVLKTFAERPSVGMLSFAQAGATLALDFPNKGAATEALFSRLDAIVLEAGGRIYLGKDARMPRSMFEAGYPRLAEFLQYRDPGISSEMSRRLMGS
jgi:FAD/FMN-containing dehydrogenase